jgi:hypothetical protein
MVRLIGVVLLMVCLTAALDAQVPTEQVPAPQSNETEVAKSGKTSATPVVSSEFPLDAITEFSAIMVGSIMEVGDGEVESYVYRSGNLMRMEGIEGHGYLVTDLKTHDTYGVSAGPCMHDTHPFFRASPFAVMKPGSRVERVPVGTETLDGHSVKVEDITVTSPDSPKPLKIRIWQADDLHGFPIKIDYVRADGRHSVVRYKNVFVGPQDPTLFIHPKNCGGLPQASTKKHKSAAHKKPATPATSNSSGTSSPK